MDAAGRAFGHTALFKAAHPGHLSTVRLLIERGATPQIRMKGKLTASEWARKLEQNYRGEDYGPRGLLECAEYRESLDNPAAFGVPLFRSRSDAPMRLRRRERGLGGEGWLAGEG